MLTKKVTAQRVLAAAAGGTSISATHWRINPTSGCTNTANSYGGYLIQLQEWSMYESADKTGTNVCTGATATARTTLGGYPASYIVDGVNTDASMWSSNTWETSPSWIQVVLPSPKAVKSVGLAWRGTYGYYPITFDFQYSLDSGTTWITLTSVTTPTDQSPVPRTTDLLDINQGTPAAPTAAALLMHFDNAITDACGNTVTDGGVTFSSTYSQFGGYSGDFADGTSFCTVPHSSGVMDFGTGDWTVEFWYRPTTLAGFYEIVSKGLGFQLYVSSGALSLALSATNTGTYFCYAVFGTLPNTTAFHHIMVEKIGSNYYGALNGTRVLLVNSSSNMDTGTADINIGRYGVQSNYYTDGYIDELRIVKGTGVYTSDSFTPPTEAFTTGAAVGGDASALIGTQGGQGFGAGEYVGTLPPGFSAMTGTSDKSSANYGNYTFTDGSVMVFVPKFFYRIGNATSPRYATYGANAVDIVGTEVYANEAAANAAGYAMHRAFYDGGAEKSGFFIDKYLASKTSTTSCKSIENADPISLTAMVNYNPSSAMLGCSGILADAVVLARARSSGLFNVASMFMYSALGMLSLAHGQAATGTTECAWYDAGGVKNFPKGCNNGAFADSNDVTVTYAASFSGKPKTRATANFAKTTHNGQGCGVADLNGSMYQVLIGITSAGTNATDSAVVGNGDCYVLKRTVALSSLTGGFGGANDAWGTSANLAVNYDLVTGLFPWGASTGMVYLGNSTNQVFSGATSGTSYQRTACGLPDTTTGTSAAGTNQFGKDGCYQHNGANVTTLSSGYWAGDYDTGIFLRNFGYPRSFDNTGSCFRCACYG